MSRPRPKFCVGEEVISVSIRYPGKVYPPREIISLRWDNQKPQTIGEAHTGWAYLLLGNPAHAWSLERQLRKLPPQERTQWEDCAWQPTKQGVEA